MTTLCATPYNPDASFFYFENLEDYENKSKCHFDKHGNLVEEFEIQLIDSDDSELFLACGIDQSNLDTWFDQIEFLQDHEKVSLFYLIAVAGYDLEQALDKIDDPSITESSLRDAAEQLFDECYAHEIPESIRFYIDYNAFARDCSLGGDMCEFEYSRTTYTCTNASCI